MQKSIKAPLPRRGPAAVRPWAPVRAETLSWRIVEQVRAALFAGALRSGDFLGTERSLAEQFGVSRVAARDALRSLAALGVIEVRTGKHGGIWVAHGDNRHFADSLAIQLKLIGVTHIEMLQTQAAIESYAAYLAADAATQEDFARMRALAGELESLVDDIERFTPRSIDFHTAVVEASHNRALVAQFHAMRQILLPGYAVHTNQVKAARAVAAHRRLLALLEARDGEGARNAMTERLAEIGRVVAKSSASGEGSELRVGAVPRGAVARPKSARPAARTTAIAFKRTARPRRSR